MLMLGKFGETYILVIDWQQTHSWFKENISRAVAANETQLLTMSHHGIVAYIV